MFGVEVIFWYWWVFAIVLLAIELFAPGFFFLWMAIAAAITGLCLLIFPMVSLEIQFLIFSILSVISILIWRRYANLNSPETDHPLLNKRGEQYIGRTFNLIEAIENGQGKIKVDDSLWKVQGEDCPVHTKVKITAVYGTVFSVEKMK